MLAGEVHPTSRPALRAAWHARLLAICDAALALGLLPHTNAGPLAEREMAALAARNASMGLMLESLDGTLRAHARAPSKAPALRLAQVLLPDFDRSLPPFVASVVPSIPIVAPLRRVRSAETVRATGGGGERGGSARGGGACFAVSAWRGGGSSDASQSTARAAEDDTTHRRGGARSIDRSAWSLRVDARLRVVSIKRVARTGM